MNAKGLRIKSFPVGEELVAEWTPAPEHSAFAGFLSGGIISTLLDCHGNWAAAYALMRSAGSQRPPGTVTAELEVRFQKPTPMGPLRVIAKAEEVRGNKVSVSGSVRAGEEVTAAMKGVFVAVKEGHPAFHRWE